MTEIKGRRVLVLLIVVPVAVGTWVWIRSAATVPTRSAVGASLAPTAILRVNTGHPDDDFEVGAVGLSTETSELTMGRLSATHHHLVWLMRLLGPSVLRIGANSVDFSWWTRSGEPSPEWATNTVTPADLRVLRGLLSTTGWRVLLGVDFGHFEPMRAADETRYARKILGSYLLGIEIGNEPDEYSHAKGQGNVDLRHPAYDFSEYLRETEAYRQALSTGTPGVAIYGPGLSKIRWLTEMGTAANIFTEVVQHYYPTSTCTGTGTSFSRPASLSQPPPTVQGLLSPALRQEENDFLEALAQISTITGRSTRIGETNSISYCNEKTPGRPSLGGALWALDWTLRAASAGVKGLNFNGTLGACANDAQSQNQICAPNRKAAAAGDLLPQPEYYGLLAASRLEGGRFVPTSLIAPDPLPNLTTWATLTPGGTVRIAIDNLATAGLPQPVSISMPGYTATEESLAGPSAEASGGISLGRAQVTSRGQWRPRPVRLSRGSHSFRVVVPPVSAVIVSLRRSQHSQTG